jgi:hypothetical protein
MPIGNHSIEFVERIIPADEWTKKKTWSKDNLFRWLTHEIFPSINDP